MFLSLIGVTSVRSGWIGSEGEASAESEGVIVEYDPSVLPLRVLLDVHVMTHASASKHSMRGKYRSAIYTTSDVQTEMVRIELAALSEAHATDLVVRVLPYRNFRSVIAAQEKYYDTDPERPFCRTYIEPKLAKVIAVHRAHVVAERLA